MYYCKRICRIDILSIPRQTDEIPNRINLRKIWDIYVNCIPWLFSYYITNPYKNDKSQLGRRLVRSQNWGTNFWVMQSASLRQFHWQCKNRLFYLVMYSNYFSISSIVESFLKWTSTIIIKLQLFIFFSLNS